MRRAPPPGSSGKKGATSPFLKSLLGQYADKGPAKVNVQEACDQAIQLFNAQRLGEAEALLRQARVQETVHAQGMHLLAVICAQTQRYDESGALWESMLQKNLFPAQVHANYGRSLQLQGQYERALTLLREAVRLAPQDFTAQLNLAVCLQHVQRTDEALQHIRLAIALAPNDAQGHFNLGRILQDRYAFDEAHAAYGQALALRPDHLDAASNLVFTLHYQPEIDLLRIRELAQQMGQRLCQSLPALPVLPRAAGQRLRVGLLSADFHAHPVGWFLLNVLPHVDAQQLELVGFSNGRRCDEVTRSLQAACGGGWHTIDHLDDAPAARLVQQTGVDILVDLSGMTRGNRKGVLACRPARVQLSWLGYFGTTGLPTVDYLLADPHCVPQGEERFYTEKIWRLPHTRFCMAPPDQAPPVGPLPALNKPDRSVTLASFQELAKINDRVLRVWAQVLAAVPTARLRLQSNKLGQPAQREQLLARMQAQGMDVARVDCHAGVGRADYLQAHNEVDFILDTFPYTGGTTTCEALWMGVPTLTLAQPGMLSRQGEAHLVNVGLPDWVAQDEASYVAQAVAWASEAGLQKLAQVRASLRERCQQSPLFDGPRFASDWTQALQAMHAQAAAA